MFWEDADLQICAFGKVLEDCFKLYHQPQRALRHLMIKARTWVDLGTCQQMVRVRGHGVPHALWIILVSDQF